ncbi:MAG: hypothetical protein IJ796_03625 [Lachnospiraceae bacterium]|nr:hypothetical protein [Lachnospiraceae bacterium]
MGILKRIGKMLAATALCVGMLCQLPANVYAQGEKSENVDIIESDENESDSTLEAVNDTVEEISLLEDAQLIVGSSGHNTLKDALEINVNTTVSDNLIKSDTINWYKFTLKNDGYFSVTFEHPYINDSSTYWYLEIYTYDEKLYKQFPMYGNEKDAYTSYNYALTKGTYFIKIKRGTYYSDSTYKFSINFTESNVWEKEFNDTVVTATKFSVNTEMFGNIRESDDIDWFVFTVDNDGYFSVTFEHPYINDSSTYWYLEIYTYDEKLYKQFPMYGNEKDAYTSLNYALTKGTYFIKIKKGSFTRQTYSFTINWTKSDDWEKEFNDSIVKANLIDVNKAVYGNIRESDDIDYFVFTVNEDGNYSITFDHEFIDDSSTYWYLEIYTYDEKLYKQFPMYGNEKDTFTSSSYPLKKGTYFIKIKKGSFTRQTYMFKVNFATIDFGWLSEDGKSYWYEHGERQGTVDDPQGVWGDGTNRGREIYDSDSDGWYWLDAVYGGAKAVGKEVWMPYIYQDEATWGDEVKRNIAYESDEGMGECVLNAINNKSGKWVRYDENGKMLKGWVTIKGNLANIYPDQKGNTYYYDHRTGLMAKGWVTLNGTTYHFDETTGALD